MKNAIILCVVVGLLLCSCVTQSLTPVKGGRGVNVLQATLGLISSNCVPAVGFKDCYSERYSYTYGAATAQAEAVVDTVHSLQSRDPDCWDGTTPLYIAPVEVKYSCDGDKATVNQNKGFVGCTIDGCDPGEVASLTGSVNLPVGTSPIPRITIQCFDYHKKVASNGDWAEAWTWAGIGYPEVKGKVVSSCPVVQPDPYTPVGDDDGQGAGTIGEWFDNLMPPPAADTSDDSNAPQQNGIAEFFRKLWQMITSWFGG